MFEKFQHEHAASYEVTFKPAAIGSGWLSDKLVVMSKIPLEEDEPGYDEAKANDLVMAAVEYARKRRYEGGVEFRKAY